MFTIIYHYPKSDDRCMGDYWTVDVCLNDSILTSYGDYYHDKGGEKATAFIQGYGLGANLDVTPTVHKQIADVDDHGDY